MSDLSLTVDGVTFTRLAVRADDIQRGDRLVFRNVEAGWAGPPVTAVTATVAGSYSVETINGGRRLFNAWDTVPVLRPDPLSLSESRVWSFENIDLP